MAFYLNRRVKPGNIEGSENVPEDNSLNRLHFLLNGLRELFLGDFI